MVTATFPSGKKFTRPLDVCEIRPTSKIENGILEKKKERNIYKLIDSAVSYGGKYLIVNYLNDSKNYIMKSEEVSVTKRSDLKHKKVFSYFEEVLNERIENASLDKRSMIENIEYQLRKITPYSDTALHAYCCGETKSREAAKHLIFPFGMNQSQLSAVKNAFSSQISIIEGPPGTGKTQTILNIIANILVNDKTVAIVSNNNLAVKNVYEKMAKEKLDYLIAKLGKNAAKNEFFQEITEKTFSRDDCVDIDIVEIDELLKRIDTSLSAKNKVAQLTAEINEIVTEQKYLSEWHEDNRFVTLMDISRYKLQPEKISDLLVYVNYLAKKHISFKERFHLLVNFKIFKTKFLRTYEECMNFYYSLQFYYYEKLLSEKKKQLKKYSAILEKVNFEKLLKE
ncbi:AAA domain-containing protein, partial [Listeria valentina]|uniref:AAA domain-containing protein n=1 Tax=Listeria valentina TaxID=2705293 RepID=UPI001AD8B9D6